MRTILSFIILRDCHVAEKEHKKSFRQFAHTGHYPRVICVCEDMFKLPNNYIAGLIVHECGHIILFSEGKKQHSEIMANVRAEKHFNVTIKYKDCGKAKYIPWLNNKDTKKILRFC